MLGTTIFFSYAHQDEPLVEELKKHLHLFKRQGLIAEWYDHNILPGTSWNEERERQLNRASLIVLCVTPDFLSSDYCYSIEIRQAMARHANGDAWVLPILLKPVYWENAPFATLKPLPEDRSFVTSWPDLNTVLFNIAQSFLTVLTTLASPKNTSSPTSQPAISSPEPIFMLPFHRDPFFTGREAILTRLHSLLHSSNPTVALTQPPAISGLGGIGKTQTAIEYAYQHRQDYTAILWVRSATLEEIVSDFSTIASLLKIVVGQLSDQERVIILVKQWLAQNAGWLLIFDNADDLEMVAQFVPAYYRGHIIFTTRSQNPGALAQTIDLEKMTLEEGALLLLRRSKQLEPTSLLHQATQDDVAIAQQIVQELGGLPLALNQAGAYIEETKCSVTKYLALYRSHPTALLKHRGRQAKLFGHPDPVATTWQLSFLNIEAANPAAAELLRLCAFLSPDAIPEELFFVGADHLPSLLAPLAADPLAFENALGTLLNYSLIRRTPESQTLTIHRLVQIVLQDEMDPSIQKTWAECTIKIIRAAFPDSSFENWEQCERLLLQIQTCLDLTEKTGLFLTEAAWLFNEAGLYLRDRYGLYQEAEKLFLKANEIYDLLLGTEHPSTLTTLHNLALVYNDQGRNEEAEVLYEQVRAAKERVLGKEHPDTLMTLHNLALVYRDQGRNEEAETLYEQVRAARERVLGKEHPDTLTTLDNLALVYSAQGRNEEAEALYEQVRAATERVLGKEHPSTLTTLNNLALVYINQGRNEEVEALYEQVCMLQERVLGTMHPHLGVSLYNLAWVYSEQGKYAQAEELYQRVLAIDEHVYGPIHPEIITDLTALLNISQMQGKQEQADLLTQHIQTIQTQL